MKTRYLVVLAILAVAMIAGCAGKGKEAPAGVTDTTKNTPTITPEEQAEADIGTVSLPEDVVAKAEDIGDGEGLQGGEEAGAGLDEVSIV